MSGQTSDPSQNPSPKPPLADSIRAKLEEYDVDRRLNDLASSLEGAVRHGVAKVGDVAHEHKGDLDRLLDKAATAVERHTDSKHADRISQVRGSLERGIERIADQRTSETPGDGDPASDVPPGDE